MANPHFIRIPRQLDRKILSVFGEIGAEHGIKDIGVNSGFTPKFNASTDGTETTQLKTLLALEASIIESVSIPIPGFTVNFHRGGHPNGGGAHSPVYDDIAINLDERNCKLSELERMAIVAKISRELGALEPGRGIQGILSDEQSELLALHNATLERLETTNAELIEGSERFRRNVETDFRERSDKLEADFRSRLETLESDFENRRDDVRAEEKRLTEKLQEIDDRQNTHVRRELRKEILEEIRQRTRDFKLTDRTNSLRRPVHVVSWLLMLALGAAAVYYAKELFSLISNNGSSLAIGIVTGKQLLLSAAFGATAIFYLRWLNAWFSEHSDTEFRVRQFQLDIERASWVIESALEWKDEKGGTIPTELLAPITRNLFEPDSDRGEALNPSDELASALLGSASKVRLGVGDSEIELDGKKLSKANTKPK